MYCFNCGNKLKEGDRFCDKCGIPVEAQAKASGEETPGAQQAEGTGYHYAPQSAAPVKKSGESNLMGILALVSGIISIVFGWIPFLMFVPEVLSVIFGIVGISKSSGKGMGIAGIVLGSIAFLITTLMSLLVALFLVRGFSASFYSMF